MTVCGCQENDVVNRLVEPVCEFVDERSNEKVTLYLLPQDFHPFKVGNCYGCHPTKLSRTEEVFKLLGFGFLYGCK
jgi:hypothetical protein